MKFFSNLFGKSELRPKEVSLIISPSLQEFVRTEVLPGLDISTHYFWSSFESLIDKFINRNNELLDKRNFMQDQINDWHIKPFKRSAWLDYREISSPVSLEFERHFFIKSKNSIGPPP